MLRKLARSVSWLRTKQGIEFFVNGKKQVVEEVAPELTLLDYLRDNSYTSVKTLCSESVCGFCTIVTQEVDDEDNVTTKQVCSCSYPLFMADGKHVLTSEGMEEKDLALNKLQQFFQDENVFQCGYCTPGIIMNLYGEILKDPEIKENELVESLRNNTCRCTGYRPIIQTTQKIPKEFDFEKNEAQLIFPKELRQYFNQNKDIVLDMDGTKYVKPTSLETLFVALKEGGKPIGGGISWAGVGKNVGKDEFVIDLKGIEEINFAKTGQTSFTVGSAMTLSDLIEFVGSQQSENNVFEVLSKILYNIGTSQVKNVSTVGGNIFNDTVYTSDLLLFAIASNATFHFVNSDGQIRLAPATDFLEYPAKLGKEEILSAIEFPFNKENVISEYFKQYKRKSADIPIVNAMMNLNVNHDNVIEKASLVFGGVVHKEFLKFRKTELFLEGKEFTDKVYQKALGIMKKELKKKKNNLNTEGGMSEYRKVLVYSYFKKLFLKYTNEVFGLDASLMSAIEEKEISYDFESKIDYQEVRVGTSLGRSEINIYANALCTGEAQFIDDLGAYKDELNCYLVYSKVPHGKIKKIDPSKALEREGVVAWIDHTNIPGTNHFTCIGFLDEELFASEFVQAHGQPIGLVVAETRKQARDAAEFVEIDIEELPAIISIDDAIEEESFFDFWPQLQRGNPRKVFQEQIDDLLYLEGEFDIGGQRHFYGEAQGSIAIPYENDEIVVIAASQDLTGLQKNTATALAVPQNKIIAKSKRMGGAYGGKQSRGGYFATLNAIAAKTLNKPTRLVFDRRDDTICSAPRHPWKGKYKVAFTEEGQIEALEVDVFSNGGWCIELSIPVMEHGFGNMDNCYMIPNERFNGYVCKTNTVSPSAFRGFGFPQCVIALEEVFESVALKLGMDPAEVKEKHFYCETDVTPYGQSLEECRIDAVWGELMESSDYKKSLERVKEFNSKNKYKKKGLGITPLKYGFSYSEAPFLNHGSALVNIYTDGSVQVAVGGTEMGQGLMTKCCQAVASAIEAPFDEVYVVETATNTTPNAAPTAASIGSDVYSGAAYNAAMQLQERLKPFKEELNFPEDASWGDVVITAFLNTTNLSAQGYYELRELKPVHWPEEPNVETPPGPEVEGIISPYYIYGASCAEVTIDCLTGELDIERLDLVMDLGNSQSPQIDVGQVEGGLIQGVGWVSMEEQIMGGNMGHEWYEEGKYYTQNLDTYKIPLSDDMPGVFNISLLKDSPCHYGFMRSKCSGEPPLYLGSCVFFAAKNAVQAYRKDALGLESDSLKFGTPATVEKIRAACSDEIVKDVYGTDNVEVKSSL